VRIKKGVRGSRKERERGREGEGERGERERERKEGRIGSYYTHRAVFDSLKFTVDGFANAMYGIVFYCDGVAAPQTTVFVSSAGILLSLPLPLSP
jgi:hypothetical protein